MLPLFLVYDILYYSFITVNKLYKHLQNMAYNAQALRCFCGAISIPRRTVYPPHRSGNTLHYYALFCVEAVREPAEPARRTAPERKQLLSKA
jgi:hypothetical protein